MEDLKLKQLIADSLELDESEDRERIALAEAERIEADRLIAEAAAARLEEVKGIPPALLPYCKAAQGPGRYDRADDIAALKNGWRPERFIIDAPNLARISFQVAERSDGWIVRDIKVDGFSSQSWRAAIAAAARLNRDNEERKRSTEFADGLLYQAAMRQPSTAEKLEAAIREMITELIRERE